MDIRVYRISTCHWCDKVESFLKRHDINCRTIVIDLLAGDEQEKAISESYHLSKQRSFPVTYIDGTCVIGFHESRLRHLLKLPSRRVEQEESELEGVKGDTSVLLKDREKLETFEKMRDWLEREAKSHGYAINPDQKVVEEILTGLAVNEKRYGYKACPCRLATGKYQMDCDIICPCSYCYLDVEKNGRCYCSLFVSDRFVSGDPSLPEYLPDTREHSGVLEKSAGVIKEGIAKVAVETPQTLYKIHMKVIGFMQDLADKNKAREDFLKIAEELDVPSSSVQCDEDITYANTTFNDMKIAMKLRQDQDVYVYQIKCMAMDGKAITGEKLFHKIKFSEHKNKLFECYIIVQSSLNTKEDVGQLLPDDKRYVSYLYSKTRIIAVFGEERAGKDTFQIDFINPSDHMFDKIVEDIVTLETNYYLLCAERQRYILADDRLNQLDATIVAKMGIISMNLPKAQPEALKGWLHGLSNNFGEISGVTEESRHRMNYTILKRDVIRKIFKDWGENNGGLNYPLISRFLLERVDSLGDQYQRLFTRIDGIRREMMDLITMLRTKIDLILQEQSLELQRSVDETTKTQMIMQHTVEGLSVIVLSYYIIHLAGFIFESIETSHILYVPLATAKAIFVPIAIAISWYLTFRTRRYIRKHSRNKPGKKQPPESPFSKGD